MWRIIGSAGKDLCDSGRRRHPPRSSASEHRVLFGLSHATCCDCSKPKPTMASGSPGWNRAKRMILVYLQGGPSHLDLWDPKRKCSR
jgi:hypothetical protein